MAKANICDRCGMYYVDSGCKKEYYITTAITMTGCHKDLCPDCQQELNDFMNNGRVQDKEGE